MVFIRKFKTFIVKHEKKIIPLMAGTVIIIGPHFGGTLVGDIVDRVLIAGTVLANGRILEIF